MLINFQHSTRKRDHVHINPLQYGCPFHCDSTVFSHRVIIQDFR